MAVQRAVRPSSKSIEFAMRAPWRQAFSNKNPDDVGYRYSKSNGFIEKWRAADSAGKEDVYDLPVLSVDPENAILVADEQVIGARTVLQFNLATNASQASQVFFINPFPYGCTVEKIRVIYATANGAALTGKVYKVPDGVALASGTALHATGANLNTTTNTYIEPTLDTTKGVLDLAYKDRLGFVLSTTVTSLAGLVVEVTLTPGGKGNIAVFRMHANGDLADQAFHIANYEQKVARILYVHSVLGTDAGAVNLQVVKDTGTDAPGAGTDLLTDNTAAGFNCKAAINTVQVGTLATTAGLTTLAPGNRLSVDFAGTLTALAGVVVAVLFEPSPERVDVTYNLAKNANLVDECFFIADRAYEVVAVSEVHSTAGTDGGAVNVQLTLDRTTDAPGAGTDLLSNNTNAGFNGKGTANTVQDGTFIGTKYNRLLSTQRLSVDYAGVLTALAGVVVTVTLKPC